MLEFLLEDSLENKVWKERSCYRSMEKFLNNKVKLCKNQLDLLAEFWLLQIQQTQIVCCYNKDAQKFPRKTSLVLQD